MTTFIKPCTLLPPLCFGLNVTDEVSDSTKGKTSIASILSFTASNSRHGGIS